MLEGLIEIADNFVGADLRAAVDFDSTDWEGVRWSSATAWPPGWEDRVHAISVPIGSEIFEVAHVRRSSYEVRDTAGYYVPGTPSCRRPLLSGAVVVGGPP